MRYIERFVHLENESTACDSKLLEIVANSLQEDRTCILEAEVAVEDAIAKVVLRCIFEEPHPLVLIFSGKDDKGLISPPATGNDDRVIGFQEIGVPSVTFESYLDEAFVILAQVDPRKDHRNVALHFQKRLVLDFLKHYLHIQPLLIEVGLLRNRSLHHILIHYLLNLLLLLSLFVALLVLIVFLQDVLLHASDKHLL